MKIKLLLSVVAGSTVPILSNAQVLPTSASTDAAFLSLLGGMYTAANPSAPATDGAGPLYYFHDGPPSPNNAFLQFSTNVGNTNNAWYRSNSVINPGDFASLGEDLFFRQLNSNLDFFKLVQGGTANLGFFGFEAADTDKMFVQEFQTAGFDPLNPIEIAGSPEKVFEYGGTGITDTTGLPVAVELSSPSQASIFRFQHENIIPAFGVRTQEDEIRFAMFEQYDPNSDDGVAGSYLIFIEDRNTKDVDYDDGLFYFAGEGLVPVPEPSLIAGIALLGLGAIVTLRRRKLAKKA